MTEEHHDIPDHLLPQEQHVLTDDDAEVALNENFDTDRTVYAREPKDGKCPYCGLEYERVTWASNVRDSRLDACPYPVEKYGDFIVQFVHASTPGDDVVAGTIDVFCSPEYENTHVRLPASKDYDLYREEFKP